MYLFWFFFYDTQRQADKCVFLRIMIITVPYPTNDGSTRKKVFFQIFKWRHHSSFFFLSKEERDFSLRVIDWMGENKREGILFFLLLGSEQQFGYAYNAFYGLSDSMLEAC